MAETGDLGLNELMPFHDHAIPSHQPTSYLHLTTSRTKFTTNMERLNIKAED